MLWYVAKRTGAAVVVMLVVTLLTFFMTRVLFPDPIQSIMGGQASFATQEQLEQAAQELGLNQPLFLQYFHWLGSLVQGNFGQSFTTPESVSSVMLERFPATLQLILFAIVFALIIGTIIGVIAALSRGSWLDTLLSGTSVLALSIPNFFLGILLVYVFSLNLGLFPSSGYVPFFQDPIRNLEHIFLPALTLSMMYIGVFSRYARALMLGTLSEDYVMRAHASGLKPGRVIVRHALKNTTIPMVTVVGLNISGLIGGAVVTESIFSIAGVGRLFTDSILNGDFPVLQGLIVVVTLGVVVINLLVDLVYGLLDPRIKVA